MKIFRLTFSLGLLLIAAGSLYAYQTTSNTENRKIRSLTANIELLSGDASRGEYVANMGGCITCHTDHENNGQLLAGGVPLKTMFGTFYSPNITSDPSAGLDQWTTIDFAKAMTLGKSPDNKHYFPAFPFTSYTVMSAQDLIDLKVWLDTVEPVSKKAPSHDLHWPFSFRPLLVF